MKLILTIVLPSLVNAIAGSLKESVKQYAEELEGETELELAAYTLSQLYFRGPIEYHSSSDSADIFLSMAHRFQDPQDQVVNTTIKEGRHVVFDFHNSSSKEQLIKIDKDHDKNKFYIIVVRKLLFIGSVDFIVSLYAMKDLVIVALVGSEIKVFNYPVLRKGAGCMNTPNPQEAGVWREGRWFLRRSLFGFADQLIDCEVEIYMYESEGLGRFHQRVIEALQRHVPFVYFSVMPESSPAENLGYEVLINMMGNHQEGTTTYATNRLVAVVPRSGHRPIWRRLVDALDPIIWVAILACLFAQFLYAGLTGSLPLLAVWGLFLGNSTTGSVVNHPSTIHRLELTIWLLSSNVIIQMYLSSYAGHLTVPSVMPDIDTLEDLGKAGIPAVCNTRAKNLIADDEAGEMVLKNCLEWKGNVSAQDVALRKAVFFSLMGPDRKDPTEGRDDVKVLQIMSYQTSFSVKTWSRVIDEMNRVLSDLAKGGFLSLWEREQVAKLRTTGIEAQPVAINIGHVSGIFFLLQLGQFICALVFIGEVYWHSA